MKGVCLRYTSNVADAEDLLQESFIRVFQKLHLYKEQGKLGAWIRTVTVNCILEKFRNQKNRKEAIMYVEQYFEQNNDIDSVLESMAAEELLKLIQRLPEHYRVVFNLFAIEGYQHDEIAEQLDIQVGTSKSQYSRARKMLQEMLEKEGYLHYKKVNYDK
jgi:RNA polymerase sigma-70 factor (ECF subfamily)